MSIKRLVALTTICFFLRLPAALADCPGCYNNQQPLEPRHGYANGRRIVNVGIKAGAGADSWASPPGNSSADPTLRQAVGQGMNKWNVATDTTSSPPKQTAYVFQSTNDPAKVDIVVVKMPKFNPDGTQNPLGHMETGGGVPYQLRLREDLVTRMSLEDLAAAVAHEIGHRIGLTNKNCPGTIMHEAEPQPDGTFTMPQKSPSSADVRFSNYNFRHDMRHSCLDTDLKDNFLEAGGEMDTPCQDMDADGLNSCDGDCNDNDPLLTMNCYPGTTCGDESVVSISQCDIGAPICEDWKDNDCDGLIDTDDPGCVCMSPIVVDPEGDGFDLSDAEGGVVFDMMANGIAPKVAWINGDDAWLALDRNGNGLIDDGKELFGNFTAQPPSPSPNGFLALAEFDKPERGGNRDGVIDRGDAVFADLRLWRDANHNGVSEREELHPPDVLGVARIHLDYKESKRTDEHGNHFRYRAKVGDDKGRRVGRWAWDVFLISAP